MKWPYVRVDKSKVYLVIFNLGGTGWSLYVLDKHTFCLI